MAPKEPNRHQLSSRLSYSQHTPTFLQKFKNKMAGVSDEEEDEEFEDDGSGRPPIPRRPKIPQRPDDDPGSADEDDGDEKPQVVVLKEGKHLTALQAENVRRQEKGLAPLSDPQELVPTEDATPDAPALKGNADSAKTHAASLSFSSKGGKKSKPNKRKVIGDSVESMAKNTPDEIPIKKAKKARKALLSFGDDT